MSKRTIPDELMKRIAELHESGDLDTILSLGQNRKSALDYGRVLGQSNNEERRSQHHAVWRAWILEFKTQDPSLTTDSLAVKILQRSQERGIRFRSGKSYALRTVMDFVKKERAAVLLQKKAEQS